MRICAWWIASLNHMVWSEFVFANGFLDVVIYVFEWQTTRRCFLRQKVQVECAVVCTTQSEVSCWWRNVSTWASWRKIIQCSSHRFPFFSESEDILIDRRAFKGTECNALVRQLSERWPIMQIRKALARAFLWKFILRQLQEALPRYSLL